MLKYTRHSAGVMRCKFPLLFVFMHFYVDVNFDISLLVYFDITYHEASYQLQARVGLTNYRKIV